MPDYKVVQGDCIASIATRHGLLTKTIWDHAKNANLREMRRENEHALLPGDVLFVPERRKKQEDAATAKWHKYTVARPKSLLRIRFEDHQGKARTGVPYTLVVDGSKDSGTTSAEGEVKRPIPADARTGVLTLNPGKGADEEVYHLRLGHLDPADETTGLQGRLQNFGFYEGAIDGDAGSLTQQAIAAYQRAFKLEETGTIDADLINHLEKQHGN